MPELFKFSLLLVQLKNKRIFCVKDALRASCNHATIAFVQREICTSGCLFADRLKSNPTSAVGCKLRAHERTTAHPARCPPGVLSHLLSLFRKEHRPVAALSKEV